MEPDRSRRIQIVLATLLMSAGVYVLGNNFLADREPARLLPKRDVETPVLLKEAGMFDAAALAPQGEDPAPPSKRDLATYYGRRAYPGAPPPIPHRLLDARSMGGGGCNGCHRQGGWVPLFDAYTPVTPHPQWLNCLSCHVPAARERGTFRENHFVPAQRPEIRAAALPGGPPPVPHSLDNRTACQACHAGPGAVKEIRTPHPDRPNCRQCHVSLEASQPFRRP